MRKIQENKQKTHRQSKDDNKERLVFWPWNIRNTPTSCQRDSYTVTETLETKKQEPSNRIETRSYGNQDTTPLNTTGKNPNTRRKN